MFFPSLLESYGLPFIEAMAIEKPILTSDLDFARSMCGDAAYYFDPFDSESILSEMVNFSENEEIKKEKITIGSKKFKKYPNWEEIYLEFDKHIKTTLK